MKNSSKDSFAEKHPILNLLLALFLLFGFIFVAIVVIHFAFKYICVGIELAIKRLSKTVAKLDAVIIVALITGCISVISSIVSKWIDYRQKRQEYLAKKREEPYGAFVDMIYKIQQNTKQEGAYTEAQMIEDLSKFSKQITLWGSSNVVNKWVKYRENGLNPDYAAKNLFVLEDIMNEMRKDLGLKKVKKGNLLSFFINDIKTALKKQ